VAEEYVLLGRVSAAFGVRGWLKITSWTEPPEKLLEYPQLFCRAPDREWQPLSLADGRVRKQGLVVRISGCEDRTAAEAYLGRELGVRSSDLPTLPEGYYWRQLEGAEVWTEAGGGSVLLGSVQKIMETGANDVLVLHPCAGSCDRKGRLVPWLPGQTVLRVELEDKRIWVDWPPDF